MKLAIIGGRDFNDWNLALEEFDKINSTTPVSLIISGGALGADFIGKKIAKFKNIEYKEFPAEWTKYGKSAGYIRNELIVNACDEGLAFWDGISRGTAHTISLLKEQDKKTYIFKYEPLLDVLEKFIQLGDNYYKSLQDDPSTLKLTKILETEAADFVFFHQFLKLSKYRLSDVIYIDLLNLIEKYKEEFTKKPKSEEDVKNLKVLAFNTALVLYDALKERKQKGEDLVKKPKRATKESVENCRKVSTEEALAGYDYLKQNSTRKK